MVIMARTQYTRYYVPTRTHKTHCNQNIFNDNVSRYQHGEKLYFDEHIDNGYYNHYDSTYLQNGQQAAAVDVRKVLNAIVFYKQNHL